MFDWISDLDGLNPIVAALAIIMVTICLMVAKTGIPAIIESMKKGETKEDVDLFKEMQALAKTQIAQVREEMNTQSEAYERKLNRLEERISTLEEALHTSQYKLRLATDHILVQENYISLHLPERSDHPVRPPELRVQTISTTTMYHN